MRTSQHCVPTGASRTTQCVCSGTASTCAAASPENAWHYLEIRGTAELADDPDRSAIDAVARKYMGQEHYDLDPPGTERVTVTVHIEQVSVE